MIELRILVSLLMLSIASYYDIKKRRVHDIVWIIGGIIGLIFYIFDFGYINYYTLIVIALSSAIAIFAWYIRLFGGADALAIIALSIILPIYENIPVPIVVLIVGSLLALIVTVAYNISINILTLLRDGNIFKEFDEPWYRKVIAFFFIHKANRYDRFVYVAEDNGKFKFIKDINSEEENVKDKYVSLAIPYIPYILVALLLLYIYIKYIPFLSY